jgi:DNA-binding Lrp family transcriptional regulator
MFEQTLNIDETDKEIITLLQENPEITHSEISRKVKKSQPAVGARILNLQRKDLISTQIGINFKRIDLKLAKVEMLTKNVDQVLKKLNNCPFVLNAFKQSGNTNLFALVATDDMKVCTRFVDTCLRTDPNIISISVNYIISTMKNLVLPINFEIEKYSNCSTSECFQCSNSSVDQVKKLKSLVNEVQHDAIKRKYERPISVSQMSTSE